MTCTFIHFLSTKKVTATDHQGETGKGEGNTVKAIASYIIMCSMRTVSQYPVVTARHMTTETNVL